ncbi:MAG: hypothetical protein ACUVRP_01175 [Chlorobiales bacterium]
MQQHLLNSLVLEAAEVAYCIADESGNIVEISETLANLLDVKSAEALGKFCHTPCAENSIRASEFISTLFRFRPNTASSFRSDSTQDLDRATRDLHLVDDQLQAVLDAVPAYISWVSKDGTSQRQSTFS